MFLFTEKPSSGSHSQYLAKITSLVQHRYRCRTGVVSAMMAQYDLCGVCCEQYKRIHLHCVLCSRDGLMHQKKHHQKSQNFQSNNAESRNTVQEQSTTVNQTFDLHMAEITPSTLDENPGTCTAIHIGSENRLNDKHISPI